MINIVNLERTQAGGVVVVHWTASKTEGEHTATTYGTKSFSPDPNAEGFVAFESLTEETVRGWFSTEETAKIESTLDADLLGQAQPQIISGVPWT